jgi:hypothetical protein
LRANAAIIAPIARIVSVVAPTLESVEPAASEANATPAAVATITASAGPTWRSIPAAAAK